MLYFAYGSNMDWSRMRDRCARAQFLLKSLLPDYDLQFTRTSRKLKCGTADIVPAPGKSVWGVVYHLEVEDRRRLDEKEGVGIGAYRPENIRVYGEGEQKRPLAAFTYVVSAKESPRPKPSRAYLEHLLEGAEKWQLPAPYIEALRSFETLPLSDPEKAKALARTIATRVIEQHPVLWRELKEQIHAGYDVGVYGGGFHMDFLGAVNASVTALSEPERALLRNHLARPQDASADWTFQDSINGDILNRAKRGVSQM
jgi:hypothetical protein